MSSESSITISPTNGAAAAAASAMPTVRKQRTGFFGLTKKQAKIAAVVIVVLAALAAASYWGFYENRSAIGDYFVTQYQGIIAGTITIALLSVTLAACRVLWKNAAEIWDGPKNAQDKNKIWALRALIGIMAVGLFFGIMAIRNNGAHFDDTNKPVVDAFNQWQGLILGGIVGIPVTALLYIGLKAAGKKAYNKYLGYQAKKQAELSADYVVVSNATTASLGDRSNSVIAPSEPIVPSTAATAVSALNADVIIAPPPGLVQPPSNVITVLTSQPPSISGLLQPPSTLVSPTIAATNDRPPIQPLPQPAQQPSILMPVAAPIPIANPIL